MNWEDGYEESSEVVLTHKSKYSFEELHDLIYSFIPDIFEKAKEEKIKDGEDYAKKFLMILHSHLPIRNSNYTLTRSLYNSF